MSPHRFSTGLSSGLYDRPRVAPDTARPFRPRESWRGNGCTPTARSGDDPADHAREDHRQCGRDALAPAVPQHAGIVRDGLGAAVPRPRCRGVDGSLPLITARHSLQTRYAHFDGAIGGAGGTGHGKVATNPPTQARQRHPTASEGETQSPEHPAALVGVVSGVTRWKVGKWAILDSNQ